MEQEINIDCRWSDAVDETFTKDFIFVTNSVFGDVLTPHEFVRQYSDNIYGRSVIVVVYIDGKPSAARALWRNDINGKEAYQPGGTCVLEACRGKGIFTKMTKQAIAMLPPTAIIYNFPNYNSFPGYMKMGWTLLHDYKARLFTSHSVYAKEHSVKIDAAYANWWLKGKHLTYAHRGGHYYLLQKDQRRPLCFHILGETSREVAEMFPRTRFALLFYKSERYTWYNRRLGASHVVTRNPEVGYIPTWKIDAV